MSGSWLDALQPASWRGVPFAVLSSEVSAGRKVAEHEYPFRDTVWVEDLGKKGRGYSFRGFLVGDDCYDQEQAMLDAAESPGPGELVHPSLGSRMVSLVEFTSGQDQERGRVVSLSFRFREGTSPLYPGSTISTGDAVNDEADDADTSASSDFGNDVSVALTQGENVVQGAIQTAQGFVAQVNVVVNDAGRLANVVAGIVPPAGYTYGRFVNGALGSVQAGVSTAAQALAAATTAQAAVTSAASSVNALAAGL